MLKLSKLILPFVLSALAMLTAAAPSLAQVAPRPPMGWNSWDAFGFTLDEAQFRANVAVLASLKPYGWSYAVIDEGWYMGNPLGDKLETRAYRLDGHGLLQPVVSRFPSAANGLGLKGLADWTHAQGLKFGVHVVRGIPKQAVSQNLPIAGSTYHAADAADRAATCAWDDANYGVADNAAGQAYYDSMLKQYADWGVDFLKVDCIADHPYRPSEIRQIGDAIRKTGRPILLSLSPGPAQLANVQEMERSAQMWRIADDLWDGWAFPHASGQEFPNGVRSAFDNLERWNPYAGPEHWPDADMLPFGSLRPHPGWGDPRQSRLTPEEARTAMTLWAIARSPLIVGGDLAQLDGYTRSLLSSPEIIALNQRDGTSRPVKNLPALGQARVWTSTPRGAARPDTVAVFNLEDKPLTVRARWSDLGLPALRFSARNLWDGARSPASDTASFVVPGHGVAAYRVSAP